MFLLRTPTPARILAFAQAQASAPLTCAEVGWTWEARSPDGNVTNHHWAVLYGEDTFRQAAHALRAWALFRTD
ncbi:hypothetical protein [Deinococcus sp.]|uniref:hypothetical protein n=1 Tax=Deinococcus sp. TaxID=47478 RepID=UPI002869EB46|nr:hypothetical protein [Deinococcus sp.]